MKIEKAHESLHAAEICFAEKLYNSTANRAYYAIFQAAIVALAHIGIHSKAGQWSHEGLRATFGTELTRARKIYPNSLVRYLADSLSIRNQADYEDVAISTQQARQVLNWAREFLTTIEQGMV